MIITIDGPAASGKSTVAQLLATRLGFYYLYTGLLYRAVAWLYKTIYKKTTDSYKPGCFDLSIIDEILFNNIKDLEYLIENGKPEIKFQGRYITEFLYTEEMGQGASILSTSQLIRDKLIDLQRSLGKHHDLIADGRDCGTIVFPHADFKFFLTASLEVRAQRLLSDPERYPQGTSLEQVIKEVEERDYRDQHREVAPLCIPENAIVIDNSGMTIEKTLQEFLYHVGKL